MCVLGCHHDYHTMAQDASVGGNAGVGPLGTDMNNTPPLQSLTQPRSRTPGLQFIPTKWKGRALVAGRPDRYRGRSAAHTTRKSERALPDRHRESDPSASGSTWWMKRTRPRRTFCSQGPNDTSERFRCKPHSSRKMGVPVGLEKVGPTSIAR